MTLYRWPAELNGQEARIGVMQIRAILLLAALVAFSLLSAGCVTELHAVPGTGDTLGASLIRQEEEWSLSRGCYWNAEYQVFNRENMTMHNVMLHVEMIDDRTGAVRDARDLFIGTLSPGESRQALVQFDGECTRQYGLRATTLAGA
jgi:hypothetical protein